jgi:hypothetical protein
LGEKPYLTYGTLDSVKVLCSLAADIESYDDELNLLLAKASDFIDDALRPYEEDLPLSKPDAVIGDVAEFYAAGLYLQKNAPDEKPHGYVQFAERKLQDFVKNNYETTSSRGIVKASAYTEIDETD